ncbi:hypothetical protein [Bremerella alba]|uniref:Lipoprotein n=1 Tax=Bremerella alba TaxID=980252 RepID=A0A7V8V6G6_9BACT|nr:hypothetical protein [Bremerella alba]MBA2115584.1 hypothetical protein [Bremerella alba]
MKSFHTIALLGRFSMMAVLTTFAAAATGCSGGLDRDQVTELIQSKPAHQLPVSDRHISNIELEHQQGNRWKVDFDCTESAAADWLTELDPAALKKGLADSVAAYEAALNQHTQVRWPEREPLVAMKKDIDDSRLPRLFRAATKAGEEIKWRGTAMITDDESGMKISSVTIVKPFPVDFDSLSTKGEMGDDAAVSDGSSADPIVRLRTRHSDFVKQLKQAEATVNSRLTHERTALNSLVNGETVVSGPMVGRTNSPSMVTFQFEMSDEEGAVNVVAIDSQDTFSRAVFDGMLSLPPTPTAKPRVNVEHDGWKLNLNNADSSLSPLSRVAAEGLNLHFDRASGQYNLADQTRSTPLTASESTSDEPVSKRLTDLQQVGAQTKGTESISGFADRQLAMTVTQFDEPTGNLRVLFEDKSSPFTFAVFEGKYRTQSPHHLGLPIQLKQVTYGTAHDRSADDSQLFTRGSNYTLTLLPTEKGFIGRYRKAELTLGETTVNEKVIDGASRWKDVVTTGSIWRGTKQWRSKAVEEVTLRVAEVRNEGKYVRLLMEKKDRPLDFVVYEGSWNQTHGRIDGYSLTTLQKGKNTTTDNETFEVFFSRTETNDAKKFRLSPSGETLYGLSKGGEIATLKRDDTSAPSEAYTTAAMMKKWPAVLQSGREWNGQYTNVRVKETTNINMKVLEYELEGKRVTVEITAEADRRVKGVYQGSVNLTDPAINGFTLVLARQKDHLSKITLFNKDWEEKFVLRYDATNERLIGRSGDYQGLLSHMTLNSETKED